MNRMFELMNRMFELPPGRVVGVLAIAVTALVTFTLGQFSFFGLEFLAHWQLSLGGSLPVFLLFSTVWGTGIQCLIWAAGAKAPFGARTFARVGPGTQSWLGGLLVVLLLSWWLAREEHDCVLMAMPATSLLVFGLTLVCEGLVIHRIRAAGHDRAAFAALLALAALMMFSEGEIMAVDHFRKGLVHFERDHAPIWSITESGRGRLVADFGRKEFVLSARTGDPPFELARPFPARICK